MRDCQPRLRDDPIGAIPYSAEGHPLWNARPVAARLLSSAATDAEGAVLVPASRLARLGSWCYRRRRAVLAAWVAALAATLLLVAPLAGDFKADFNTPGSDSAAAEAVLNERFGDRSAETI